MRAEICAFEGLLPLLVADWQRGWLPQVLASDASPHGWGVSRSMWTAADAATVGRVTERARFVRSGGMGARQRALEAGGFVLDEASGKWGPRVEESIIEEVGRHARGDFPEARALFFMGKVWREPRSVAVPGGYPDPRGPQCGKSWVPSGP